MQIENMLTQQQVENEQQRMPSSQQFNKACSNTEEL